MSVRSARHRIPVGTRIKKVIVIGLDGLEPRIVDSLFQERSLPHLARLASLGGFSRVATTTPAQTPVAWSSFATGVNPGGHGIFDFLRRDPKTYLPDLGLNRYEQKSAFLPPKVVNLRRGVAVWDVLSKAGIPSVVIRCPCTYPPDRLKGRLLSGMGVPDIRGGLGTATLYTSDPAVRARESEQVIALRGDGDEYRTILLGPRSPKNRSDVTTEITVRVDRAGACAQITGDGQPKSLALRLGTWSDWLRVTFRSGWLQATSGALRFLLLRLDPHVELYASPVNFDPAAPVFPISHPWEYASELAQRLGLFYTTGMVEDHTGLSNERFSEQEYLAQCELVMREREAMLTLELARLDEGLLFCLFDTPDRVQHMFWRFREPEHPANRGQGGGAAEAAQFGRVIEEHYARCDAIVGRVLEAADDRTLVIVLSDHGFGSFQRGVHLNAWLNANGFLTLKDGVEAGAAAGEFLRQVDWRRTRAYALGLGSIYLNVQGREAGGIVAPADVDQTADEIARGLAGLRDPARDTVAVRGARTRVQLYSGPYALESPDVVVDFAAGYRVSWPTALGGVPESLFEDNVKKWGGDHIMDPALVPGVLFMSRPFRGEQARLVDLAPTILAELGVPKEDAMEGDSLRR